MTGFTLPVFRIQPKWATRKYYTTSKFKLRLLLSATRVVISMTRAICWTKKKMRLLVVTLHSSLHFWVIKYPRAVKQKVWKQRSKFFFFPRSFCACKSLMPRLTDFFTEFEEKTDSWFSILIHVVVVQWWKTKKNLKCVMHMQGPFFASSTKWYFPKLLNVHARTVCSRLIWWVIDI